jgi:hypothetical protein
MPPTFFIYERNATPIKEGFHALCCPCHVFTLMKKVGMLVKTSKKIYYKKEKHICWVMVAIKVFFCPKSPVTQPPYEKELHLIPILFKCGRNDNISQCANAINRQNNVDLLMKSLKRRWWKNVGLLPQNINLASLTMDVKTSQMTSWDAIFSPPWALKGLNMVNYF